MIRFRTSEKSDVDRLKQIWKMCFHDEDPSIDFFFDNMYREDKTFLLTYNLNIAAMLTELPVELVSPDGLRHECAMIYAVATDPSYQGKGFSTLLLEHVNEVLNGKGVKYTTLVPASESLFDFYGKREYVKSFAINEKRYKEESLSSLYIDVDSVAIRPVSACEYNQLREELLKGNFYVSYSINQISYQKGISQNTGGDIYRVDYNDVKGLIAAEKYGDTSLIKEMLVPDGNVSKVLLALNKVLPCKEYIVRTPVKVTAQNKYLRYFGMLKGMKDTNVTLKEIGYLGLAFD